MELICLNQKIELTKFNQGMGLIKSSYDIQALQLVRFSITTDDMTLNHTSIVSRGYI